MITSFLSSVLCGNFDTDSGDTNEYIIILNFILFIFVL